MKKTKIATIAGIAMLGGLGTYNFFKEESKSPEIVQEYNEGLETIFGQYDRFNNLLDETFENGRVVSTYEGKPLQYKLEKDNFNILLQDNNTNGSFDNGDILGISTGKNHSCSSSIKIVPLSDSNLYRIQNPVGYCKDRNSDEEHLFQSYSVDDLVDLISKK